jgi:Holliday junction resolvase RusA-like endonuclease
MYNPGTAEAWKHAVAVAAHQFRPNEPLKVPLRVDICWYLPRPKRLCRKGDPDGPIPAPVKPDKDNLEKSTLDALTMAGMWTDDALVCWGETSKWYHPKGGRPGAVISISDSPSVCYAPSLSEMVTEARMQTQNGHMTRRSKSIIE